MAGTTIKADNFSFNTSEYPYDEYESSRLNIIFLLLLLALKKQLPYREEKENQCF